MVWWEPVLAFVSGLLPGVFFFGGLWWTVQRLPHSRSPALLALASFILRAAAVMAVFYLVLTGFSGYSWHRPVFLLAGFILARVLVVARLGRTAGGDQPENLPEKGVERE